MTSQQRPKRNEWLSHIGMCWVGTYEIEGIAMVKALAWTIFVTYSKNYKDVIVARAMWAKQRIFRISSERYQEGKSI